MSCLIFLKKNDIIYIRVEGVSKMANRWYLYLDDERSINAKYEPYIWSCYVHGLSTILIVRDYNAMVNTLEEARENNIEVILDLDHDLGPGLNGYDVCKYLISTDYTPCKFHLHTMNPVGRFNMRQLLKHHGYEEF